MPMIEGVLNFHEVFLSIQGESAEAGLPCVFVRLYGCNVRCSYCDQPQYRGDRHKISVANLISKVIQYNCKNICITGGEPLIQTDAVYQLALELISDYDCNVSIETNGCVAIPADLYYPTRLKFVMDIKCPSSGVSHKNVYENLMLLRSNDEVKFVISNRHDYDFMKKVLKTYPTSAHILVSPMFKNDGSMSISKDLVDWLLSDQMYGVRVQVQLHKILEVK